MKGSRLCCPWDSLSGCGRFALACGARLVDLNCEIVLDNPAHVFVSDTLGYSCCADSSIARCKTLANCKSLRLSCLQCICLLILTFAKELFQIGLGRLVF
jgi:hypothetical protein